MLVAALIALAPSPPQAPVIQIYRGATLTSPVSITTWDVADTTLDPANPDESLGGDGTLMGGPGRTILIRFGDLSRVVPAGKRIKRARMVLTRVGGETPVLRQIRRLQAPWGEGPFRTLTGMIRRPQGVSEKETKANEKPVPPRGASTYKMRRAGEGGADWQQSGAIGPNDGVKIDGARLVASDQEVAIEGLEATLQNMADRWSENYGFSLNFENAVEFASSQSAGGRPRLELELEDAPVARGADLSVVAIERRGPGGQLPKSGEEVTYTAHVKNVGDAAAKGFVATWVVDEKPGNPIDVTGEIRPGEEKTVTFRRSFRDESKDPRFQSVLLRIRAVGDDASTRNDALEVHESAKAIEVVVTPNVVQSLRGEDPADWVQRHVRLMNDVYLPQSRFSFAPEGAKARVAVQRVTVGTPGSVGTPTPEGSVRVSVADPDGLALLRTLAIGLGLNDLSAMSVARDRNTVAGRGSQDRFPGLMGYGDTRFEGTIPGQIGLPYEPYPNPIFDANPLEATGLLAATDVAILNSRLEGQANEAPLTEMPKTVLLRALDSTGRPLNGVELSFFQSAAGQIQGATPAFTLVTGPTGTVILPSRDNAGPYGKLEPTGGNGVYLIRAVANGVTEWGWIKAWQLADAASRGNRAAAIMDVRFNLPSAPLEEGTNLAAERIVADAAESLPAKIAPLVDGSLETAATLGEKVGDWIEVDLARDRTVGEIVLTAGPDKMWNRFDVVAYATGQRSQEAIVLAREVDWRWSANNRGDLVKGLSTVRYRVPSQRVRFLRIINRGGGAGSANELRVTPVRVGG